MRSPQDALSHWQEAHSRDSETGGLASVKERGLVAFWEPDTADRLLWHSSWKLLLTSPGKIDCGLNNIFLNFMSLLGRETSSGKPLPVLVDVPSCVRKLKDRNSQLDRRHTTFGSFCERRLQTIRVVSLATSGTPRQLHSFFPVI